MSQSHDRFPRKQSIDLVPHRLPPVLRHPYDAHSMPKAKMGNLPQENRMGWSPGDRWDRRPGGLWDKSTPRRAGYDDAMGMLIARAVIAGLIVAAVAAIGGRYPKLGALLLTLPIVSIIAFVATWQKEGDLSALSRLARETLILVPLSLPFFIPLALADRLHLGFWPALLLGVLLASATIGGWFWISAKA
jgi:hypothetical protein